MSVVATVLTGRRPRLLERTLRSSWPILVDLDATVIVLINGADGADSAPDFDVVSNYPVDTLTWQPEWTGIGESMTRLAWLALQSGADHWLHLEDDWEADDVALDYQSAADLLDSGKVGQVRLRHTDEPVLSYDMVTKRRITWRDDGEYRIGEAHLTFNPSLIRVADIPHAFPCTGEQDAQRKWRRSHRRVAQHVPGIWRHIGDDHSLRKAHNQ